MGSHREWGAALLAVLLSWLAGRIVWAPGQTQGFERISFSLSLDIAPFLIFLPVILIGVRASRAKWGWVQLIGEGTVVLALILLGYVAFFSSFGGVCLDPGEDVCVVTDAAHVAHAVSLAGVVGVAWLYATRFVRPSRCRRDVRPPRSD